MVVRQRPQFFSFFEENLDLVVDSMCQFDFLACVVTAHATGSVLRCYPNFGAYFSHRTLPIVHDLIKGGPSRAAVPELSDVELAKVLTDLSSLASQSFFDIAGWEGYERDVREFIEAY